MELRAAIIGCGRMGRKRAGAHKKCRVVLCVDIAAGRAEELARSIPGAAAASDWRTAVARPDIDLAVVCTPNDLLSEIAVGAVEAGKLVLVEKPVGRSVAEVDAVAEKARARGVRVKAGFNHRHHPAVIKAKEIVDSGGLGPLIMIRGVYGHGGRPGYEGEWRARPETAGGGQLIDQGIHLIDLSRYFLGEFSDVWGTAATLFWKMPVEDNAFLCLKTDRGGIAWLHAGWTEWKNRFSFEIFGKKGKLHIEGLGGSYGTERLTMHVLKPGMGPPETTAWDFPGPDPSWALEFEEFLRAVETGREPSGNLGDARAALVIVERIYGGRR